MADLSGLPLTVEDVNPKLAVVDLLNSDGVCFSYNQAKSKQVKVKFETQTSQKSIQRTQSDIGYEHYVAFKNENTFVHDQLNGNFVYLRKALLNTKKMVLDLSDTTYGVFA